MVSKPSKKSRQIPFNQRPIDVSGGFFLNNNPILPRRKKGPVRKYRQDGLFLGPFEITPIIKPEMNISAFVDSRHMSESEMRAKKNKKLNLFF